MNQNLRPKKANMRYKNAQLKGFLLLFALFLGFQSHASPCRSLIQKAFNLLQINRDSAYFYANQGLTIAQFEENDTLIGMALMVRGEALFKLGKFELAREDFKRRQELSQLNAQHAPEARAFMWVGETYLSQDSFQPAVLNFEAALKHWEAAQNKGEMAMAWMRKGKAIERSENRQKAREAYSEALKIARKAELKEETALAHQYLGFISLDMEKTDLALQHLRNALVNFEATGNEQERAVCLKGLTEVHLAEKKYHIAQEYAEEGLKVAQEAGSRGLTMDFYQLLGDIMAGMDDFERATDFYRLNALVRDSLAGNAGARELSEIVLQYEKDKAVLEKEHIAQEAALQEAQLALSKAEIRRQQTWFYIILGGLGFFVLFGAILSYLVIQKNRANRRLEKALNELRTAQNQLVRSEKMASLGQVTAGIAHEIRNPLNFVTNLSKLSVGMIDELGEELNEADTPDKERSDLVSEYFGDIRDNTSKVLEHGERAGRIVKDMLSHAASETGEKAAFPLNEMAEEYFKVAFHSQPVRQENGKEFNCDLVFKGDEKVGMVKGVRSDIGRAMLNIMTNAFEAVQLQKEQKGEAFQPKVIVETKKRAKGVEVVITDNGPGVSKEDQQKIFDPFFTTKPPNKGTGLGLSLAFETIVLVHKGKLNVESELGKGTSFKIFLPA